MKNKFFTLVVFVFTLWSSASLAGLLMTYHQLTMKDLDQMNEFVNSKLKEARKSSTGKIIPLREGLQAVFSRPNDDGMIAKIYSPLRNELERQNTLEKVYKDLIDEAIHVLTHPQNFKPDVQTTYAIFLENLISEFKPMLKDEASFEKKMIEKIANASIELSNESLKERKRRLMKEGKSPSVLANLVLKEAKEEQKPVADKKPAEPVIDKSVVPGQEFESEVKSK